MGYQPKLIRGRVKNTGYPIDNCKLIFSLWDYDNYESYHLIGWSKEEDEIVMKTIYQSEKEAGLCLYDTLEEFARAWKSGKYEPECTFCLPLANVEMLEEIQPENKQGAKMDGKDGESDENR